MIKLNNLILLFNKIITIDFVQRNIHPNLVSKQLAHKVVKRDSHAGYS